MTASTRLRLHLRARECVECGEPGCSAIGVQCGSGGRGDLAPGQRLNEVRLAADLGVSRTPLREALTRLAAQGTIEAVARMGFFVKPLSVDEYRQTVPVRTLLESEALKAAGIPPKRTLERMASLERKMASAQAPGMVTALEDDWHVALIELCPNPVLIELIDQLMARTRRYELAFMREQSAAGRNAWLSEVREQLNAGDLETACTSLREQLDATAGPVIEWLEARPAAGRLAAARST